MSLFPSRNTANDRNGGVVLIKCRAGKMILSTVQENGKFNVTADPRRGEISLIKGNDGIVRFKWTNTVNNIVEDDRMVFPGENIFKRVNTGRTTDRVYMLKYLSGSQRLMYWMQAKSPEKDEDFLGKVNDYINNPNLAPDGQQTSSNDRIPPAGVGGLNPEEWMQMLGYYHSSFYLLNCS
jgi:hypothetical protein